MFKVLFILSTLKKSGPVNIVKNIIKYIDKKQYTPLVLTLSSEPKDSDINFFINELKVEVFSLDMGRIKGMFFLKQKISKFILDHNIDLIHTHGLRPDIFSSDISIKKISTLHNDPFLDYSFAYGKVKGFILAKTHLYFLKNFDFKISCSKSISQKLNKITKLKFDYIQNGIETPYLSKKIDMRNKLNFSSEDIVFISVGVLNDRKNPLTIAKAFDNIIEKNKNIKIVFLGDGELMKECLCYANDNILFLGYVNNVNEYLVASDYFISASFAEGLPNSVLEALYFELPCVLSNIPSHYEIIQNTQLEDFLFGPDDINDLENKINDILKENYSNLSKASKEIIINNFTAKDMSKKYQNLYKKLIGESV